MYSDWFLALDERTLPMARDDVKGIVGSSVGALVKCRSSSTTSPRQLLCHPKGRNEVEEPRSGLTRRLPWRSRHIRILGGSCRISQGAPIDIARRSTVERRVRAHIVVKVEPGVDHALCIASIGQFVQVHRLVLQRPPQPLDEDVVEIAAAAVHGAACASRAYPVGERDAGKLGTLVRVEYLRGAGMQRRLERVDAENAVHRV